MIVECVVQVSPSVQFLHLLSPPVPQWEANACAVPCGGCQKDAGAAALKPAVWPGPAVFITKAERDLLPHSYTTFCHNSPQTEFPCKANILQPSTAAFSYSLPDWFYIDPGRWYEWCSELPSPSHAGLLSLTQTWTPLLSCLEMDIAADRSLTSSSSKS